MKGQVTIINLLMLLITFIVYFALLPILTQFIDATVVQLQLNPNAMTSAIIMIMYAVPFLICLMIVMTGFNYAIPRREGFG